MLGDSKINKTKKSFHQEKLINEKIKKAKYIIDTHKKELDPLNANSFVNDKIKPLPKRYSRTEFHASSQISKKDTSTQLQANNGETLVEVEREVKI